MLCEEEDQARAEELKNMEEVGRLEELLGKLQCGEGSEEMLTSEEKAMFQ